jgi:hypothetical protein
MLVLVLGLSLATTLKAAEPADEGPADPRATLEKGAATLKAGDFDLTIHGRFQVWGGWVGDDALLSNGDPMQSYGFRLRRARLGFEGHVLPQVTYGLELDLFDQERTGGPLHHASVSWKPCHLAGITAGLQKLPFVYTDLRSSARLASLDRPRGAEAMSPGNTLGLTMFGSPWKDHLTLTLGAFNGPQRRAGFYNGYEGVGVSLGNRFERLALVGRLDLQPLDKLGSGEADLDKLGKLRLGVGGGAMWNDGRSVSTLGFSGYLHLKGWGAFLLAEGVYDQAEPQAEPTSTNAISARIKRFTANCSAGYMILAQRLGVAVRAELVDDNLDADDEGDEVVLSGTLTWYQLGDYLKAQVEFQHREELHGQSLTNDAAMAGIQLAF